MSLCHCLHLSALTANPRDRTMSFPNSRTRPCTSATQVRINLIGTPCPQSRISWLTATSPCCSMLLWRCLKRWLYIDSIIFHSFSLSIIINSMNSPLIWWFDGIWILFTSVTREKSQITQGTLSALELLWAEVQAVLAKVHISFESSPEVLQRCV